jgi:hypothetical protein
MDYGLLSAGDDPTTGNTPVTGGNPLIHDSVVFTLTGLPSGFDPSRDIGNITFQYGTSLSEPNIHVPGPGAWLAFAAAGFLGARRRRA